MLKQLRISILWVIAMLLWSSVLIAQGAVVDVWALLELKGIIISTVVLVLLIVVELVQVSLRRDIRSIILLLLLLCTVSILLGVSKYRVEAVFSLMEGEELSPQAFTSVKKGSLASNPEISLKFDSISNSTGPVIIYDEKPYELGTGGVKLGGYTIVPLKESKALAIEVLYKEKKVMSGLFLIDPNLYTGRHTFFLRLLPYEFIVNRIEGDEDDLYEVKIIRGKILFKTSKIFSGESAVFSDIEVKLLDVFNAYEFSLKRF